MNKKYMLLSALVFSFGLSAEKIQSVDDYLSLHADDSKEATAAYLSKRCAATFLVVAKIFNNKDNPDDKMVSNVMADSASRLIGAAAIIDASVGQRDVLEVAVEVNKQVKRIFDVLWEISEDSYARTAIYLTPHVNDLKACKLIAQI